MRDPKEEIELPEGFQAEVKEGNIIVRGNNGELIRELPRHHFTAKAEPRKVTIEVDHKKYRNLIGTFGSHIRNMIRGLQEPWVYKLKICSSHFPMTVELKDRELVINNFFGERSPRKVKLPEGINVEIQGDIITITSPNKESAGSAAGNIEKATKVKDKDVRIFSDGVYITMKAGKKV